MNELNSKLKARKEIAEGIMSSCESKETFYDAELLNLPEARGINSSTLKCKLVYSKWIQFISILMNL